MDLLLLLFGSPCSADQFAIFNCQDINCKISEVVFCVAFYCCLFVLDSPEFDDRSMTPCRLTPPNTTMEQTLCRAGYEECKLMPGICMETCGGVIAGDGSCVEMIFFGVQERTPSFVNNVSAEKHVGGKR